MTTPSVVPPIDSDNLKRCSKCGEWKPATLVYFSRQSPASNALRSICKPCASAATSRRYQANKEKRTEYNQRYRREHAEDIRAYRREYYAANRDGILERTQQWRALNKEHLSAYNRANAGRMREWSRARRIANPEKEFTRRREWRSANPDKDRAQMHRRRARKRGLPDTFTAADWQAALDHFGGCCAVCGRPPGLWHTLAADHWIPLSSPDCPGTVPWNIVPLCHGTGGCNNSKGHRCAGEWLVDKLGQRKGRAIQRRIEDWLNSLNR